MVRDIIPAEGWIPRSASIVMIAGTPICDTTRQLRWVIPMSIAQPGYEHGMVARTGPIPTPSVGSSSSFRSDIYLAKEKPATVTGGAYMRRRRARRAS